MEPNEALKILEDLKNYDYNHCIKDLNFDSDKASFYSNRLYNHCIVVGNVAKKIAKRINLDYEKAYILGLLHDIGRFNSVRFHGLTGYEIAMKKGWSDVAQIALTHSFINDKIEAFHFPNNEFKDADIKKTKEIFSKLKLNEYDYMVRMGDFISIGDIQKPVTVEERLHDIRTRYPMDDAEFEKLSTTIFNLKNYWDKRLGCNLYEIL